MAADDDRPGGPPAAGDGTGSDPASAELDTAGADAGDQPFALVAQFFLIPLAVVVIAVAIFLLFGRLSGGDHTPTELLGDVRTGSLNRRWQAAYQLATELARKPELGADEELFRATLAAFREAREADVKRYLVLALGRFEREEAVPVLLTALAGDDDETRLYAALALASTGDADAVGPLAARLGDGDEDPAVRKAAAYALGHIGDPAAIPTLRPAAEDRRFSVALQAALALAQLGDDHGRPMLYRALDPAELSALDGTGEEMTAAQQEEAALNAIQGLALLADPDARQRLAQVGASAASLKVRDAARRAGDALDPGQTAVPNEP